MSILKSKHNGWTWDLKRTPFVGGGGGGQQGPTTSTVNNVQIPDYLRPQVEAMLGAATQQTFRTEDVDGVQQITGFNPYVAYSNNPEDYVAGFSPMQQQAFRAAANLQVPGQFGQATNFANAAGMGGLGSVNQAYGYGNQGAQSGMLGQGLGIMGGQQYGQMGAGYGQQAADIGQMGLRAEQTGRGITQQSQDYARQQAMAGQQYAQQATDPSAIARYMNPYTQSVVDVQSDAARRAFDIAQTQRQATAARAGAYGGSRQAIENAEAQRALQSQLAAIQATGQQSAYDKALANMQFGSTAGLQGLSGAQSGLGTALQGGQLGLSGIGTALQGLQGGMQGAGVGLQGVDRQLAGTGQGMQGAQVGLQGVSGAQAGYNLANTAGSNLANIGQNQLAAQQAIINMQNQFGGQQQTQQQNIINNAINNYAMAQQYPQQQLAAYNALLRGYSTPTTTTSSYQAAPSPLSQLGGLGMAGAAAYGLAKKKGGVIKSYASGGNVSMDPDGDDFDQPQGFASGGISRKVLLNPDKYSAQMIDRSTKNGVIDDIVGLVTMQEKNKEAKERQAQAGMGQGMPPTIKDQILAEAQQLQGIDSAPSNLPTEYASGGIVAFSGEEGSQVKEPKGYFERMKERISRARESNTTVPEMPSFMGIPLFGSAGSAVNPNVPLIEQGAAPTTPAAPVAKPDTGIRILPDEPRAKPSMTNAPAAPPASDTGTSGIDDLIRQLSGDIKAGSKNSAEARKDAKLMGFLNAGLGLMSGTSPYTGANFKNVIPAVQGYQEEMRAIRGDEAKQIAQLAALNLKGAELKQELKKLGISEKLYNAQADYYRARARAPMGVAGLGGAVPPNVSQKVMQEYKGYVANPTQAPFFSSLPKDVQTGLTKYKPGTESYNRSLNIFKQYSNKEMMDELSFYGSLNRRSPVAASLED